MAFLKVSAPLKIIRSEEIKCAKQWHKFRNTNFNKVAKKSSPNVNAKSERKFVVSDIDTSNFRYDHVTILHSVNLEDNGYWITPETEKFINANNDAWSTEDLYKDAYTFIGGKNRLGQVATVFEEHDQDPRNGKGRVKDLVIREIGGGTIAVELLIATEKTHSDLISSIDKGYYNAVSMGCTVESTKCSICGNSAKDSAEYCEHVANLKPVNGQAICSDGKYRKVAELCVNSHFYDCSWVHNPADNIAFHQNVIVASTIDNPRKNIVNIKPFQNAKMRKVASKIHCDRIGFMETQFNKVTEIINFAVDNNFPFDTVNQLDKLNAKLAKETVEEIFN